MPSQKAGARPAEASGPLPEAPSLPLMILWAVGIALASFTVALLIWFGTLSQPERLEDTWLLVAAALLAEVLWARQWLDHRL